MSIYIRCDGSPAIGLGHVTRMLALARQIADRESRSRIFFAMRNLSEHVSGMVKEEGFEVMAIPGEEDTFSVDPAAELAVFGGLADSNEAAIVIDHYGYELSMIHSVRALCKTLILIDDDQPDRCTPEIDMLVNPGFSAETVGYPHYRDQAQLLGPRYSMLREQFDSSRYLPYFVRKQCEHILICMGGSDPKNMTVPILQWLDQMKGGFSITVITGSENRSSRIIRQAAGHSRHPIMVKNHVYNMAEQLLKQDLVVLPSSTMAMEAMALGIPCAVLGCEDNQLPGGLAMKERETAVYLGDYRHLNQDAILHLLQTVIHDTELRMKLSDRAKKQIDGDGAKRVAAVLLQLNK